MGLKGEELNQKKRDHGGGLDAAIRTFGGSRIEWIDLSTGINPHPYPVPKLSHDVWTALPDHEAQSRLVDAARVYWGVPDRCDVLAASGASVLIAQIPSLRPKSHANIATPTYNEHAAAFEAHGWTIHPQASAQVVVHPNNPDGKLWSTRSLPIPNATLTVIDESFCDTVPEATLIEHAATPGTLVLKSFGKFWGLAGMRLGFAIGDPDLIAALRAKIGPWPVAGPALEIGAHAFENTEWSDATRLRLAKDSIRLDQLMNAAGAQTVGGTTLFRLYEVDNATAWQRKLAQNRIWSRIFPYNDRWLRLGLPADVHWPRVEAALQ